MGGSDRKYRMLFENAPVSIVVLSVETGRFVDINERAEALFGLPRSRLLQLGPVDLSPARQSGGRRSSELAREIIHRAFAGEKVTFRWDHLDADGAPLPCRVTLLRLPSEDTPLVTGILSDAREELAHELALEEGRDHYRALAEANFQGVVLSVEGRTIEANDAFARMFGYPPAEVPGLTTEALAVPDSVAAIRRNVALGLEQPYRATARRKDGSTFPVEILGRNTTYQGGRARVTGVMDLTDQLRAERERQRLEAQVHYAQKLESLGVMAGGIAHDFNNLLQGILGNAELARLAVDDEAPVLKYIERIERIAQRSGELTDQMLAYAGRGKFVTETLEINRLVGEMSDLLAVSISKKVRLETDLDPALPAIVGDAAQLRQVLMNLITNASEAIGDRPGAVVLRTGVRSIRGPDLASMVLSGSISPGRYVVIEVSDDGEGMDEVTLARLYDPFFTTKFTGRGLGLASVQGIVRGHGGGIEVVSVRGQGTTFRILLPASAAGATVDVAEPEPEGWMRPAVVLVADDEPVILEILRTLLEREGLEVITADDGRAAAETYRAQPQRIDLVVLDMTMPVRSGEETLRAIQQVNPAARVLLSSGNSESDVESLLCPGLVDFIHKPFSSRQLLSAVRSALLST